MCIRDRSIQGSASVSSYVYERPGQQFDVCIGSIFARWGAGYPYTQLSGLDSTAPHFSYPEETMSINIFSEDGLNLSLQDSKYTLLLSINIIVTIVIIVV